MGFKFKKDNKSNGETANTSNTKLSNKLNKNIVMISAMLAAVVVLSIIAMVVFLGSSGNDGIQTGVSGSLSSSELGENAAPSVSTPQTAEKLSQLEEAKLSNADTMAWLNVGGTSINAAVMQTTNNDYYLRRDENREESLWGCYFADYYANLEPGEELIQNTVIYGHTDPTEDPSAEKFSSLYYYKDIDFLRENPYIYLTVNNDDLIFEIFAVFYTDISHYYIDPYPSNQGFETFLQDINNRNEFVFDDTVVTEDDKLITLSGCSYIYDTNSTGNHRFVVMGKLVDAEREDISININENPVRPNPAV